MLVLWFPGHQVSWVIDCTIEYTIFLHLLAEQWRPQKQQNLARRRLSDEDDAQTSNTCIAQRKRAIPHSTMKNNLNIIVCCSNTHQGRHVPANKCALALWSSDLSDASHVTCINSNYN